MNSKMMALAFSFLGLVASFYSQETKTVSSWKKYKFGNFLLTIDPEDEANKTYIYQEIQPGAPFPPALDTVKDFFVGVDQIIEGAQMREDLHIGIPLESNPRYISSLTTASENYAKDGSQTYSFALIPGKVGQIFPNVRPTLRNAIDLLIFEKNKPNTRA